MSRNALPLIGSGNLNATSAEVIGPGGGLTIWILEIFVADAYGTTESGHLVLNSAGEFVVDVNLNFVTALRKWPARR